MILHGQAFFYPSVSTFIIASNENERRENLITEIVKLLRDLPVAVVRELYAVALEHKKNNAGRKAE